MTERGLRISPEQISVDDFVGDEGVTIVAGGCTPGTTATMQVTTDAEGVEDFTTSEAVVDDGSAVFAVRGLNPAARDSYRGTYTVTVECEGGEPMSGTFVVGDTTDDSGDGGSGDGGSGDGSDDDRNGSDLPRTGAELSGLAAGAVLLLIGGAAVALTRRARR